MKLLAKLNLLFIALFLIAATLIGYEAHGFLLDDAREQVLQQARLMIESATSTRNYTSDKVAPLLERAPESHARFLPQTIPFYAATVTFEYLRKHYPDYLYKEAALNPTNPRDRATEWEAGLIDHFRGHSTDLEFSDTRDTATGPDLFIARPIAAQNSCMECHSIPSEAPPAMVQQYGPNNGFGWKPGEIIGAQIVSVPMKVPMDIADRAFKKLIVYLAIFSILGLLILNASVYLLVIRPAGRLALMADRISNGDMEMAELPVRGKDEIALLTASFNRMYVSLQKAFRMLNE